MRREMGMGQAVDSLSFWCRVSEVGSDVVYWARVFCDSVRYHLKSSRYFGPPTGTVELSEVV